MYLIEDKAAGL